MKRESRLNLVAISLGFTQSTELYNMFNPYYGKDRYYHNDQHIEDMFNFINNDLSYFNLDIKNSLALNIAILFHDIVYVPGATDNEFNSWLVCENAMKNNFGDLNYVGYDDLLSDIERLIMATKDHNYNENLWEDEKLIIKADLNSFNKDWPTVWKNNVNIFKEFQKYSWPEFQQGQILFLKELKKKLLDFLPTNAYYNIEKIISTLEIWEPNIAIYPGSFNPFHKGHLNILEKAEKIFDKVIIAKGINPEKNNELTELPDCIKNREIIEYDNLLTDTIDKLNHPVTIIRGLRNITDMAYEQNQYRWLQDLDSDIKMVSIFCDKEFEHISSSGIRLMKKYNKHTKHTL